MNRITNKSRSPRVVQPTQHVYLPHSSWARVERKPAPAAPIAPDDFWARLGI